MNWSDEQKLAIDLRNRELLVSAAAGSGKTTVLVERLIKWVTEPGENGEDPEDLDRFLVVTFTRAAAAEMRSRLYKRLMTEAEKAAEAEDMDRAKHIRRQLALIGQAHVQTIDSFASYVLRNHFHLTDLDPAFRIGDEGELALMRQDVLSDLLEECYASGDQSFRDCMDYFTAASKKDDEIADIVLRLYDFSQSTVDPEAWLSSLADPYRIQTEQELDEAPWNQNFYQFVRELLSGLLPDLQQLSEFLNVPDPPKNLADRIEKVNAEAEMIRKAAEANTYREFYQIVRSIGNLGKFDYETKFLQKAFPSKKRFDEMARFPARVKTVEDKLKKAFRYPVERVLSDFQKALPAVEGLADLPLKFGEQFREEKGKHGLIDFSDAEHIALKVLWKDGRATDAAKDLAESFREILIDEYQDSNDLQEALLNAVSTAGEHGRNVFMVGDKKQSIYMFRHAKPELFVEKFDRFLPAKEEPSGEGQVIELNANYRSRDEVTDIVNFWFERLMRKSVGAIDYNEREMLRREGTFFEEETPVKRKAEFLIADLGVPSRKLMPVYFASDDDDEEEEEAWAALDSEAHMIASKIRELVDAGTLVNENGPGGKKLSRRIRYQDIVILVRDRNGQILETLSETMAKYGIPSHAEARTGFYSTQEIRYVMNFLRVLNNPVNDPALAAVMKNPLSGFTNEDLAEIVATAGRGEKEEDGYKFLNGFFGRVRACLAAKGEEDPLGRKIKDLLEKIEYLRKCASEMTLSQFLRLLYRETGLTAFASAQPNGKRRLANLEQLIGKAHTFEQTSYAGLFNFIRYIEKKEKTETEEGEANTESEKDNVVRIMTMHGSKGLEFPVVFLPKIQKTLGERSHSVQMNSAFGVGIAAIDLKSREKTHTYYERVVQLRAETESRGEELRILYVAMTRAKERLFLTAGVHEAQELIDSYQEQFREGAARLSTAAVIAAPDMLTWLLNATDDSAPVDLQVLPLTDIRAGRATQTEKQECSRKALSDAFSAPVSAAAEEEVDRIISTEYLRDDLSKIPASVTVSRLKAAAAEQAEDQEEEHNVSIRYVKDDKTPERITGSQRGTLYHLVMERMDPHKDALSEVARLTALGLTSKEEQATIKPAEIDAFWASPLGKRFLEAFDRGQGFREKQFILALPVREIPELYAKYPDTDPSETVMIQGVIDLYFEEADGLVLLDYKTDIVDRAEILKERYAAQLYYYRKALEAVTGKKVKESYIWSFRLRELIPV